MSNNEDQIDNTNVPETENTPLTDPSEYTVLVERLTGTVKWFNNRAGFGFITVCEPGEYENKEIFVHWSSIRVSNSQYKYLFQGEYVDFTLVKANSNKHEYQAMNVSGVKGGPIMCETRRTLNHSPSGGPPSSRFRSRRRDQDNYDRPPRRESSSGDGYRPRNSRPRPPRDQSSGPSKDNEQLLDYVKVQSKRTRRSSAPSTR